jgi:hypothetical protein
MRAYITGKPSSNTVREAQSIRPAVLNATSSSLLPSATTHELEQSLQMVVHDSRGCNMLHRRTRQHCHHGQHCRYCWGIRCARRRFAAGYHHFCARLRYRPNGVGASFLHPKEQLSMISQGAKDGSFASPDASMLTQWAAISLDIVVRIAESMYGQN